MTKSTFNIAIIGAGQIGSRHLQALKKVGLPLTITVIDPSKQSLAMAKRRYEEMPAGTHAQTTNYLHEIPSGQNIDLAIIATTSSIRAGVIKNLLKKNRVRYFILEKILFDKKNDYHAIENIFTKLKIKAWVNCPMRVRPIYKKIKEELSDKNISLRVTGNQWGLITNAIHYLDFLSFVTGSPNFSVNTDHLNKRSLRSKRKGFLELGGTLSANFENGSSCELIEYASGKNPPLIEVFNKEARYIILDLNKSWVSKVQNNWKWKKISFKTPLISETTTAIVENILKHGRCALSSYQESIKIHLSLLEPLRLFLNKNSDKKYNYYPFT